MHRLFDESQYAPAAHTLLGHKLPRVGRAVHLLVVPQELETQLSLVEQGPSAGDLTVHFEPEQTMLVPHSEVTEQSAPSPFTAAHELLVQY